MGKHGDPSVDQRAPDPSNENLLVFQVVEHVAAVDPAESGGPEGPARVDVGADDTHARSSQAKQARAEGEERTAVDEDDLCLGTECLEQSGAESDPPAEVQDYPTRTRILKRARQLAGLANRRDTLLLFFSGHGLSLDGKGYLVPIDSQHGRPEELVSIAELREILRGSKAAKRIMILDACHSGSEKDGAGGRMSQGFAQDLQDDTEGIITLASCIGW